MFRTFYLQLIVVFLLKFTFLIAFTHNIYYTYPSEPLSKIFSESFLEMNFEKITHGTFNQSNLEFGDTAGRQCTCCCLYAVVFSRYIKTPGCINTDDLDVIVREGDKLYKSLNTDTHLEFSDLPKSITTFGFKANISYLSNSIGLLNPGQNESFLLQNKHCNFQPGDGMLFIVKGYCICLIIRKNTVFLFDSHSRNERGKPCPDGFSS